MKRLFDFCIAFIFSILLLPIWILIAILLKLDSKGPIFFRQVRIGLNEKPFRILKFRTMITDAEQRGLQITVGGNDPRITKFGYILRKYKLDELPQIFNVILGEMSFVGPRPEVPKYVNMYSAEQRKVFQVRPGITDIASIEYIDENELLKNSENPEKMYIEEIMQDKLRLNLEYLKNRKLISDISIIFKTISKVIK